MNWFRWKPEFVTYEQAAAELGWRKNRLYVMKHYNKNEMFYIFKDPNLIDIGWLRTNIEKRNQLQESNHTLYYALKEHNLKDAEIARQLMKHTQEITERSWQQFVHRDMWNSEHGKRQLFTIPRRALAFNKAAIKILKELENDEKTES